ncbi:hypothetical protein H1C71_025693, partial [Ictidomys tridecemlineatus]
QAVGEGPVLPDLSPFLLVPRGAWLGAMPPRGGPGARVCAPQRPASLEAQPREEERREEPTAESRHPTLWPTLTEERHYCSCCGPPGPQVVSELHTGLSPAHPGSP